jgi:Phage related hypothetical protein (DUF1799)
VEVFLLVSSQWVVGGMGGVVGLSYPSVETIMNLRGIPRKQRWELFEGVQAMEFAALEVMNEKAREKK